jgi:hypothetical protein
VCLPAFLYREFIKAKGGDEGDARAYVDAWAIEIVRSLPDDVPIGDDPLKFWRYRWQERFGTTQRKPSKTAGNMEAARRFLEANRAT